MAQESNGNRTHLVVGAGRMGGALISGWIKGRRKSASPEQIIVLDPRPGEAAQSVIEKGALHIGTPGSGLAGVECVLLAVKPQMFADIGRELAAHISDEALIVSIMAGTPLATLRAVFPTQSLVRAMPNTPAAIGAGITAFTCDDGVTKKQKTRARRLLSAGGVVHEVDTEHLIDVVTAVSGSGPAYVFHLVETLQAAAIVAGLPEELAPDFARHTIIGAGELLKKDPSSATELRKAVTSPGGTTQAALDILMREDGLPPLMRETVMAALKRAKELGQG